jgi:FixJ family two-component response regulator
MVENCPDLARNSAIGPRYCNRGRCRAIPKRAGRIRKNVKGGALNVTTDLSDANANVRRRTNIMPEKEQNKTILANCIQREKTMIPNDSPMVYIVDDDQGLCVELEDLLVASGLRSTVFQSVTAYKHHQQRESPACLLLEVELPDISGLEFQKQMNDADPPVVFMTGHGDIPSSVRAIKHGAIDFLTKPVRDDVLIDAINIAIDLDRANSRERTNIEALQARLRRLTPREQEVFPLVVSGLLNKQIAAQLGISEITLQIHRGRIMRKMEAPSFADLVRYAEALRIPINQSRCWAVDRA